MCEINAGFNRTGNIWKVRVFINKNLIVDDIPVLINNENSFYSIDDFIKKTLLLI